MDIQKAFQHYKDTPMSTPHHKLRVTNSTLVSQQLCQCGPSPKEIKVLQQGTTYWISDDEVSVQSAMSVEQPCQLTLAYLQAMAVGFLLTPATGRVLNLGLGSGALIRFAKHHFPKLDIQSVEHCCHMVDMARQYFQLPNDHKVFIDDAIHHLQRDSQKYDLLMVDLPMALVERQESITRLGQSTQANGLMVLNLFYQDQKQLILPLSRIQSQFQYIQLLPVNGHNNLIVLASHRPTTVAANLTEHNHNTGINFNDLLNQCTPLHLT